MEGAYTHHHQVSNITVIIINIIIITIITIVIINTTIIIIIITIGGITWTQTSAPSGSWSSIASDSTGQYLAAVSISNTIVGGGYIYTSTSG